MQWSSNHVAEFINEWKYPAQDTLMNMDVGPTRRLVAVFDSGSMRLPEIGARVPVS